MAIFAQLPVIAPLPQAASLEIVSASSPLTTQEKVRLGQLVRTIERGLSTFLEVAKCLQEIRSSRLYRGTHTDFQSWCRETLGLARSSVDGLIRSGEVAQLLIERGATLPPNTSEAVIRPLASLPSPELQSEAWRLSSLVAPEGKAPSHTVTAKVSRMIREATEGESKRALPTRELMFTRPISRLAKIDSFDVNVCLLHVKSQEQAENISHACGVVADRCKAIQAKLDERFPDAHLAGQTSAQD
jgi:hypothetical protein